MEVDEDEQEDEDEQQKTAGRVNKLMEAKGKGVIVPVTINMSAQTSSART